MLFTCSYASGLSTIKLLEGKDVVFSSSYSSCKHRHFVFKKCKTNKQKEATNNILVSDDISIADIANCIWLIKQESFGGLFKVLVTVTHAWKGWFILDLGICILNLFLPLIGRGQWYPISTHGSFLCLEIHCFLKGPTE